MTRLARYGVAYVVLAALAFVALRFQPELRARANEARANQARPQLEREIAGGLSVDISRDFLWNARAYVGLDETYSLVYGNHTKISTPVTLYALPAYTQYLLSPRRQEVVARRADWLLCYGCDLDEWRTGLHVVWDNGDGLILGRWR